NLLIMLILVFHMFFKSPCALSQATSFKFLTLYFFTTAFSAISYKFSTVSIAITSYCSFNPSSLSADNTFSQYTQLAIGCTCAPDKALCLSSVARNNTLSPYKSCTNVLLPILGGP